MQYSHSRIETFNFCKYAYKIKYLDKIEIVSTYNADNPLLIGLLLHESIEKGLNEAEKSYYSKFNVLDDNQINEVIKVQEVLPKILELLPKGGMYEFQLSNGDFIGYLDYLVETSPNNYDLYDFKYSNNTENYKNSRQLSLYKYQFEKTYPGKKINNLFYLMVPKVQIKQKKSENLYEFRKRIKEETGNPFLLQVEYDSNKVIGWLEDIKKEKETTLYPKCNNPWCSYCNMDINNNLLGEEIMILPSIERRNLEQDKKHVVWIYGAPFTGKTTFANNFPVPLMLNTDGNIKFVDAPFIKMANEVTMNGRVKNTKLAWDVFKDTIDELEKKDNEFKTIIVDLIEDMYEHCRIYTYKKLGIEHESDNSFKAWDVVRTEFLSTIKRLMMLDYDNIILISHEDTTKDITKRTGDKVTAIKPNISDKIANKLAGMVDIVARVVANGDERTLEFKQDEVIFGGGRLANIKDSIIPLNHEEFLKIYDNNEIKNKPSTRDKKAEVEETPRTRKSTRNKKVEETQETVENEPETKNVEEVEVEPEEIKTRTRRRKRA